MDGNISTGRRTRLTVPTTAIMRQTTMMKYGLRMEKPDMLVGLLRVDSKSRTQACGLSDHYHLSLLQAAQHLAPFRSLEAQTNFPLHQLVLRVYHQEGGFLFSSCHSLHRNRQGGVVAIQRY